MLQGQAVSGLVCNIVMMIALLSAATTSNTKIYTAYLIIGNIGMLVFYYLMISFFAYWRENKYEIPMIEQSHAKEMVVTSNIEESFLSENKFKPEETTDQSTLTYKQLLFTKTDVYLGMMLNFVTTLGCFPVLTFRIDIGAPGHYKFALITLIFNIGDIGSRYFYTYYKLTTKNQVHFWNLVKISFFIFHFLMINSSMWIFGLRIVKVALILVFSFLNGYLCIAFFEWASVGLENQFDRNKSGKLLSIFLQLGLMLGSFISMIW